MKSWRAILLYGLAVWVVPFVVALLIFPLRAGERPLFESIMPVALAATTVVCAYFYLGRTPAGRTTDGAWLGVVWLAISVAIDAVMFGQGPMKMTPADYLKDIGVTYLIIPTITAGMAAVRTPSPSRTAPTRRA